MVDAPLKYHGGKYFLAKHILALAPPHLHYVEPYFGGGAVLFAKNPEGVSEVVNDINGALMNFWRVLAGSQFEKFKRVLEATPFSEELWEASGKPSLDLADDPEGDFRAAIAFFIRCRQSRQGLMKSFATLSKNRTRRGMNEQVSSWLTAIEGLPDAHARLKRVVILNSPATEVILQEDSANTFFYLDPPYLHETRTATEAYEFEMTRQDHVNLLDKLAVLKGKFILSGYPSTLYYDYARINNWNRKDIEIDNKASSASVKEVKTECLWRNY